jgi:hypothetical protein
MKEHIDFPEVKHVYVAVAFIDAGWKVYLLNRGKTQLLTVLVTSKGYGGEDQRTSILRHMIPKLDPGEYALIEPIDPTVFHLNNEYWVSFYIGDQIYDKKYIFLPDSIQEKNMIHIGELNAKGVLHQ